VFSILNHIKPNGTLTSQTFWEWVLSPNYALAKQIEENDSRIKAGMIKYP